MSKGILLICVLSLAVLCQAGLHLPKDFKNHAYKHLLEASVGNIGAPLYTQCNQINLTQLGFNQVAFSGYLNVGIKNSYSALGFIFYGSAKASGINDLHNYPTIIWLNGGPGSSSQLGNFFELGPLWMSGDNYGNINFIPNNYSWQNNYNLIFVDQPVGTGLSYADKISDIPTNQDQVGQQFQNALLQLYNNPNGCFYGKNFQNTPLFIFGESYAGKQVPAIAQAILQQNSQSSFQIPLKGIAIGDGFTDPYTVTAESGSFAYNMGLIDYQESLQTEQYILQTLADIDAGNWLAAQQDFDNVMTYIVNQAGNINVYNIRDFGSYTNTSRLDSYFNIPQNRQIWGFNNNLPYSSSSGTVYQALSNDFMQRDCFNRIQWVINQGLPTLIYNGQDDLIVPTPGTVSWAERINYSGSQSFRSQDYVTWSNPSNTTVFGYKKKQNNLELRVILKAGHLVPMNNQEAALQMTIEFVEGNKNYSN